MRRAQKLFMLKRLDASLAVLSIHLLQLLDRVPFHSRLNSLDNILVRL
jgi:hypothetical protein